MGYFVSLILYFIHDDDDAEDDEGALFSSIQHPSVDASKNSNNDLRGLLGEVHVLGV